MCDNSPPTKDNIFGTSSESELEQGEDRDVSGSAVASSKKRAAPDAVPHFLDQQYSALARRHHHEFQSKIWKAIH
jgi:hypothetical protein